MILDKYDIFFLSICNNKSLFTQALLYFMVNIFYKNIYDTTFNYKGIPKYFLKLNIQSFNHYLLLLSLVIIQKKVLYVNNQKLKIISAYYLNCY